MAGAYLYGWDATNKVWVKLTCDADGKVILDPDSKYTDAKARAACKLSGSLYWSCPGIHFDASNPGSDPVLKAGDSYIRALADSLYFGAQVNLPNGATITGVVVYGNAAAEAETWSLQRITMSDRTVLEMATTYIGNEDVTVTSPVVDNSLYAYFLFTSSLDTNDEIWGARITYII